MCKSSRTAKKTVDVKKGETYGVGVASDGYASLHPPGETAMSCVACVKDGTTMTLENIPARIQKAYGIGSTAVVMFGQTAEGSHDRMVTESGRPIGLDVFVDSGVTVYIGVKHDTAQIVANIEQAALAGAASAQKANAGMNERIGA